MLLTKNKLAAFAIFLWCTAQFSCTRKWEDHNKINNEDLTQNLYEKIAGDPSLSKFTDYLQKTGYSDTLQSTRSFTVWAPTNDALQNIDAALGNDDKKLKLFVAHHIAHLSYYSDQLTGGSQRLPLIDGKYVIVKTSSFEDAPINTKDQPATNGVLHTISAAAAPVGNCWDYIDSLKTGGNFMATFLKNYVQYKRDTTNAIQIGINPLTGAPIYQKGTDTVIRSVFIDQVYDIGNEAKEYTVFIMNNPTWNKERAKLDTFYRTSSVDSTYNLARIFTAKDMAVEGALSPEQLPDSILSKFGVWVPINKSAIQAKYRTSNGYVYVMNDMNVALRQRFPPLIIQGESYVGTSNNSSSPIYLRSLINPNDGQLFKDLYVYSPGVAKWNVRYRLYNVPTTKYRVYWATYNNRWNNTLNQRLAMGTADNTTSFPYRSIPYNVYKVDSLGEYPVTSFGNGNLDIFLVNADLAPSSSNQSQTAMFLDYIRLEPVYKQN
ncbi:MULTISPECIES: fasciclin domain-containing protein [Niastella]|uniref:Fasciclin domain-containing protein n=1 Tax=Niastella soli TaxID=2821487 RepID=A0ABS3Z0U3_9BACT|nr:fasciclin domain-containing protein [Niastella soli]MBO9203789.1 fasciclin domain-containing protein [Niastella soli]